MRLHLSFRIPKFIVTYSFLLLGFFIASGQAPLSIRQYQLPNGLTVILNEDHAAPEVFGMVVVKAGGKDDPADATGLAHYMEHMLFKGTQTLGTTNYEAEKPHLDRILELYDQLGATTDQAERDRIQLEINEESLAANQYVVSNELSDLINTMGGTQLNAGTSPDQTVFYNLFPANQIFRWIDLYAHRFLNPVFRGFQAELEVVYEEKNLYSDQFQTKLLEDFQKLLFKNHPYGQQPLIGTIEHLKNPSLRRMYEFYNTYYVASNMALILSGDFDTNEVIPAIEENFGKLPKGLIPEKKVWDEQPFNGREFHKARLTPIKLGVLGYRTPSTTEPDYVALEVALEMLNNRNQTGLLDKLSQDGIVLAAQVVAMPYLDHGATLALFIPKIVGQKTQTAENHITEQIARLGKGDFEDWLFESAKLNLYTSFERSLEQLAGRAMVMASAFVQGETMEVALAKAEKVAAVSREDVQRVALKYLGANYLAFHSATGFPKKEKITKPGFKALTSKQEGESSYAEYFRQLRVKEPTFKPINFEKDVFRQKLAEGAELLFVENPYNDIFSCTVQFQVGSEHIPLLDKAGEMMSYAGTQSKSASDFKVEFAKIGCSYSVGSSESYMSISISGVEKNLVPALALINELLMAPSLEQSKLKILIDSEKGERKMERSEADNVAHALLEYVLYGEKSYTLDRPTMKQLKSMKASQLTDAFKQATTYPVKIHYVGRLNPQDVHSALTQNLTLNVPTNRVQTPIDRDAKLYGENTVFLVNKKKARQSKVFFFANGENYSPSDDWIIRTFNEYYGGGFSGLVLQEIREYRSLAYGAAALFQTPNQNHKPINFIGYVATQADKTLTALETFDSLIRFMPQKPERIPVIKDYLILSAQTGRPNFRNLSFTVESWKHRGFTTDPSTMNLPSYRQLEWDNIYDFYQKRLQQKPYIIAIVGDKKTMDLKELQKYGKLKELEEKSLFSK